MNISTSQRQRVPRRLKAAKEARVVLIAARFHDAIAHGLVRGATETLRRGGISQTRIRVLWVPGAFELPVVASRVARMAFPPHAIIALGALIQGETPQYDVIAHAVAHGLTTVAVDTGIPVTFGVIVASTMTQAKARADGSLSHRGAEAAAAALSLMQLFNALPRSR